MPSVGDLAVKVTADATGLVTGLDAGTSRIQKFGAQARMAGKDVDALSGNFEKFGRLVKTVGSMAIAFKAISDGAESTGTTLEKTANKVQEFAIAASFMLPGKAKIAALAIVGLAEGAKFLDRQMNSLTDAQKASIKAGEEAIAADIKRVKSIGDIIKQLEEEQATFGMSAEAIKLRSLEQLEATRAEMDHAKSIVETINVLKQQKQAEEDAAKAATEAAKKRVESIEEQGKALRKLIDDRAAKIKELNAEPRSRPEMLGFGTQDAIKKLNELSSQADPKQLEIAKKQLQEAEKATRTLNEINAKFNIPAQAPLPGQQGSTDVIVNF